MAVIAREFKSQPLAVVRLNAPCLAGMCTILPMYTSALRSVIIQGVAEGLDIPEPNEEAQKLIDKEAQSSFGDRTEAKAEALETYRHSFVAIDETAAPVTFENPDHYGSVIEETVVVYRAEDVLGGITEDSKPDPALTALGRFGLRTAINHAKMQLQKKILEENFRWEYDS